MPDNPFEPVEICIGEGDALLTEILAVLSEMQTLQANADEREVSTLSVIAGETMSAGTPVYVDALGELRPCSNDHPDKVNVVGVTAEQAYDNLEVPIHWDGLLTVGTWAWTPGERVFLGINGTLTQTLPTSNYLVHVGTATSATQIQIQLSSYSTLYLVGP